MCVCVCVCGCVQCGACERGGRVGSGRKTVCVCVGVCSVEHVRGEEG